MFDSQWLAQHKIVDWGYTEKLTPESGQNFRDYLNKEYHGDLSYLADHRAEARSHLKSVFPEVQSALVFLFQYFPDRQSLRELYRSGETNGYKIASYVFAGEGKDYHLTMRDSLEAIGNKLNGENPQLKFRTILDIQPVLERDLAYRAGLGWFGKNSMLISRKHGSFTLIGSLLLNTKFTLPEKVMETDHCGHCQACAEVCPTEAIDLSARQIVANLCLSTYTIEVFKEKEAPKGMEKAAGEIFGCDLCQDVCPWNLRLEKSISPVEERESFKEKHEVIITHFLLKNKKEIKNWLETLSNKAFEKIFRKTPLGRTGKKGLLKNLNFWWKNNPDL